MWGRHGFAIRLKRLKPRAPDFGGPQNIGSKDDFQHFCKHLNLYFCFGSTHVFYCAANKRSLQKNEHDGTCEWMEVNEDEQ